MKSKETIVRKYYVSFGEIKKALNLQGELHSSALWTGLSPKQEAEGVSRDVETIEIITHEAVNEE